MDATAADRQEASPVARDGESTTSMPEVPRAPLSDSDLVVAGGSGTPEESGGGEDEQVERFYALLANIRALRDVYGAGGSSRKRARGAEAPLWKPKFRMEDFREADDAVPAKKGRSDRDERQRLENSDAAEADGEDGEVVEENDRVSASQTTCVLTAEQPA
ncbi:NRR repressor homolog 1-like [Triticum urartu]|uniref:NRR repressor homolog 1-like n=1 Tax=Triticum urartu TaxID=4572 RepID=UPI002043C6EE|nr:NRR repressor homolog 1-like [Triticum urartu]